jgi:ATP-binding cassette, subfamily A (ABC1), member 3
MSNRAETCTTTFVPEVNVPLYMANSPYSSVLNTQLPGGEVIVSPPNLVATLGVIAAQISVRAIPDNSTCVSTLLVALDLTVC